jgi:hypothetical protein
MKQYLKERWIMYKNIAFWIIPFVTEGIWDELSVFWKIILWIIYLPLLIILQLTYIILGILIVFCLKYDKDIYNLIKE